MLAIPWTPAKDQGCSDVETRLDSDRISATVEPQRTRVLRE